MSGRTMYLPWRQVSFISLVFFLIPCHKMISWDVSSWSFFTRRLAMFCWWSASIHFWWKIKAFLASMLFFIFLSLYEAKLSKVFFPPLALASRSSFLLKLQLTAIRTEKKIAVIRPLWICQLFQDLKQPAFSWVVTLFIITREKFKNV